MINTQNFKKTMLIGESLICLVDDVSDTFFYGYTSSQAKILYNLSMIDKLIDIPEFENCLSGFNEELPALFPLGQYIVILKMKKDNTGMEMYFLDFRVDYSVVDEGFDGLFSEEIKTEFKRIKYEMEDSL
jgi:hypothetical protein